MAIYGTLKNGSTGEEVKKLQSSLVSAGYDVGSTGTDGIYGPATARAVRSYQKDMGLDVDGIAGSQTLNSLYGTGEEKEKRSYSDPDAELLYNQALASLQATEKKKPVYEDGYGERLQQLYEAIVGREDFSYDPQEDPLYRQYRDQYAHRGQLAMLDTLGQASALTGGYGSSYAQQAGQQAYQKYLDQLDAVAEQLYSRAKDRYDSRGQELSDRYAMLENLSRTEYDRYQDALSQYRSDVSQARAQAQDAYDRWYDARRLDAQQRELEEKQRQNERNYALALKKYT